MKAADLDKARELVGDHKRAVEERANYERWCAHVVSWEEQDPEVRGTLGAPVIYVSFDLPANAGGSQVKYHFCFNEGENTHVVHQLVEHALDARVIAIEKQLTELGVEL